MPQPRELGRRSGPAGEASRHCWGRQEEEGGTAIGLSFLAHGLSEGRAPLAQAMGGEAPFVRAMEGWAPLVQVKVSGGF